MAAEPSWDELFASQPGADTSPPPRSERLVPRQEAPRSRREARERESAQNPAGRREQRSEARVRTVPDTDRGREPRPRRRRRWVGWVVGPLSVILVLGIGAAAVFVAFEPQIRSFVGAAEPSDFVGAGTEEVVVTITAGDLGSDVAQTLFDNGVTKSVGVFYSLLLENPEVSFLPGSYAVKKEMSAQSALDALRDPANKRELTVLLREGQSINQALELVSAGTAIPLDQLTAAASDLAGLGVPAEAPNLEGYLFPATYTFEPGLDAKTALQQMVNRTFQSLDTAGVAVADRHRVLTLAALIQREAGPIAEDFYKVSRVFTNRLDTEGWKLESDATVSYGTGNTDTINTTEAERADASNPYNTYANPGLPVGPIGAAGDLAIDAALNPVDGPWFFFVVVDLDTGETAFSTTFAEHQAAVAQLAAWCRSTGSASCE
ncbi:MAG: endolytic transglycosylase MltG [Actinomycetota bacterium]